MNSHANDRWLGVVIAAASFLLFAYYSVVTPIFEASDELWHYPMVMRLATGGGLPEQRAGQTDEEAPWRQEGSQPPLYYAAAAALTAPLDHSNWRELRRINPHADMGVPTRDGNANAVMHDAAEAFPWAGAALAVHAARLLSALFSAGAVWFAWMAAREIWPTASAARRAAVPLFVACVPMFAFISGSINNDNAAVFFASGGFWWALREMRRAKFSLRSAVIAGIFAGCGALSKSSTLGLLGLYGLAALLTLRDLRGVAVRARWLVVIVVVTVAVSGWWFARNVMLYGDLLGWNAFLDVVGRRDAPATLAQLWTEREGFVWAYWGVFGTMNVIYPEWLPGLRAYHVLDAMTIVALVGAAWGAVRAVRARRIDWRAAALCAAWIAAIFVALLRWTALTPASQGRLMFPAIGAIACVFVYGLAQIHRAAPWIAGGGLAALAIWTPVGVIAPTYAAPPNQWATSPSDATSQAESLPTLARFGDALDLHAFSYDAGEVRPGDEATLALTWTLDAPLPFDASVFVHLIDENDVIVAQRDMRPGQGSLSTARMFTPYRWSDRYTVRVPRMAPGSRALRWVVGVYDYAGGARLRTEADDDRVVLAAGPALGEPRARGLLRYDDGVRLQAMRGARTRVRPGDAVVVETEWTAPAGARDDNISLQIIDDAGNKIAQQDLGASFSQAAADGGPLVLRHTLAVSPDAAPGSYRLLLVRYTPAGDFPKSPAYDAVSDQYVGEQVVVTGVGVDSR